MKSTLSPDTPPLKKEWTPAEMVTHDTESRNPYIRWWYQLTASADAPPDATFVRREQARKARLLSTVLFFYTLVVIVFLPCCLLLVNPWPFWIDAGLILISFGALGLNKIGKTFEAGVLVVVSFQLALTVIIFTTTPFDEASVQIYDLFIMTELLAVSLLPPKSVFLVALANSGVILLSLLYQPHTAILNTILATQFIPVMIRPIALQFIIAGVAYVWVYSTLKAITRADRAEMVATLEHALVEQKRELEQGIEQILQTHVAVANGNLNARAPLNQESVLWQIARALNTLLVRYQRSSMAEKELQRTKQAIAYSVHSIQHASQQKQLPRLTFTQSAIDPLVAALQGKTIDVMKPEPEASKYSEERFPFIIDWREGSRG